MAERANVYIDGFNLYYGALKGTPYKWLDLEKFSRIFIPNYDIHRIRYFTAKIAARRDDPHGPTRQDKYLQALALNPKISIHLGRFQQSRVRMPVANVRPGQPKTVEVLKTEEKGTDVNIATYLLADAFRHDCDMSVLVSNDADLAGPLQIMLNDLKSLVGIVNPRIGARQCQDLADLGPTFYKRVREQAITRSQLPPVIHGPEGEMYTKPDRW